MALSPFVIFTDAGTAENAKPCAAATESTSINLPSLSKDLTAPEPANSEENDRSSSNEARRQAEGEKMDNLNPQLATDTQLLDAEHGPDHTTESGMRADTGSLIHTEDSEYQNRLFGDSEVETKIGDDEMPPIAHSSPEVVQNVEGDQPGKSVPEDVDVAENMVHHEVKQVNLHSDESELVDIANDIADGPQTENTDVVGDENTAAEQLSLRSSASPVDEKMVNDELVNTQAVADDAEAKKQADADEPMTPMDTVEVRPTDQCLKAPIMDVFTVVPDYHEVTVAPEDEPVNVNAAEVTPDDGTKPVTDVEPVGPQSSQFVATELLQPRSELFRFFFVNLSVVLNDVTFMLRSVPCC